VGSSTRCALTTEADFQDSLLTVDVNWFRRRQWKIATVATKVQRAICICSTQCILVNLWHIMQYMLAYIPNKHISFHFSCNLSSVTKVTTFPGSKYIKMRLQLIAKCKHISDAFRAQCRVLAAAIVVSPSLGANGAPQKSLERVWGATLRRRRREQYIAYNSI